MSILFSGRGSWAEWTFACWERSMGGELHEETGDMAGTEGTWTEVPCTSRPRQGDRDGYTATGRGRHSVQGGMWASCRKQDQVSGYYFLSWWRLILFLWTLSIHVLASFLSIFTIVIAHLWFSQNVFFLWVLKYCKSCKKDEVVIVSRCRYFVDPQ